MTEPAFEARTATLYRLRPCGHGTSSTLSVPCRLATAAVPAPWTLRTPASTPSRHLCTTSRALTRPVVTNSAVQAELSTASRRHPTLRGYELTASRTLVTQLTNASRALVLSVVLRTSFAATGLPLASSKIHVAHPSRFRNTLRSECGSTLSFVKQPLAPPRVLYQQTVSPITPRHRM